MTHPMFQRVLVAVDDSPAALAAARAAIEFAMRTGARLRFVHVTSDGEVLRALADRGYESQLATRRNKAAVALLHHVGAEAERAGIPVETKHLKGDPAAMVLAEVSDWDATLLVIGRSDVRGAGRPYVGTVTRHVLELVDIPVLVVPRPR